MSWSLVTCAVVQQEAAAETAQGGARAMASQAEQQQQHIVAEETEDQEDEDQEEEEECEDDYKERRGEERSLLGHAHSLEASPAPSSRLHHWSPGATRDLDITHVTQCNVTMYLRDNVQNVSAFCLSTQQSMSQIVPGVQSIVGAHSGILHL